MSKKAAEKESPTHQELQQNVDVPEHTNDFAEPATAPALILPHYARQDFSLAHNKQIFTQRKGDIIRDQQKLNLYKQQNQPISPFDERQTAKCPNPKCGCVFAWDGNLE